MAEAGDNKIDKKRNRLWFLLALPGLLGPLLIFGFILFSERAHDEESCPYAVLREREVKGAEGARIREEHRRCLEAVEDHRYTLVRGDREQLLGRRRFAPEAFQPPGYGWDAGISDAGEIHMVVRNPGHDEVTFREGRPDEK